MPRRAVLLALVGFASSLAVATLLVGPRGTFATAAVVPDDTEFASATELRAQEPVPDAPDRTPVDATPAARDGVRVRVLDRWTDAPVAGAEVRYLPPGFDEHELRADEREALAAYGDWWGRSTALTELAGVTVRADDAGYAELAAKPNDLAVAWAGDRFGADRLSDSWEPGVYAIHIARERTVDALVVDSRGQPRAGMHVQLVNELNDSPVWQTLSDARGIAHFPHVQDAVDWSVPADGLPRVSAKVELYFDRVVKAPVHWPADGAPARVRLDLPPVGRLVLEASAPRDRRSPFRSVARGARARPRRGQHRDEHRGLDGESRGLAVLARARTDAHGARVPVRAERRRSRAARRAAAALHRHGGRCAAGDLLDRADRGGVASDPERGTEAVAGTSRERNAGSA